MTAQTFLQYSENVAAEFLQTVVVLDDQAFFQPRVDQVTELKTPPLRMAQSTNLSNDLKTAEKKTEVGEKTPQKENKADEKSASNEEAADDQSADPVRPPDAEDRTHDLYAKTVIDSFGKRGLVCSVFRPEKEEKIAEEFLPALQRADLVVLDWIIHKDDGKSALTAIKELLLNHHNSERRGLRLIAVYTGQNNLRDIAKRIKDTLIESEIVSTLSDNDCTVKASSTTICVFAKPDSGVASDLESRIIKFDELPTRLIHEFARATCGLIPNLLLSALSALRQSTHGLLLHLNKDLDAAFLSHQCLLEEPDDARHLALQLVADEFKSIMDEYGVLETLNKEVIESWLKENRPTGLTITWTEGTETKTHTVTIERACKLLENGYVAEKGSLQLPAKAAKASLTKLFLQAEETAQNCDNHFAMLTTCKSRYRLKQPVPVLTLGTLLSFVQNEATQYLLCILPVCDSVRLKDSRSFPFLPLSIDQAKVYFVARHDDSFLNLRLHDAPFDCIMKSFKPRENERVIKAALVEQNYQFTDAAGTVYTWIGELKFAQAQRVVSNFAAQFSRVGLDESEWLRKRRES